MDIAALANGLTSFLGPLIPYLVKGGEKAAEVLGQELGKDGWKKAEVIWDKLRDRLGNCSAAVKEISEAPEDDDARAALRVALKQSLKADPVLAGELIVLLNEAEAAIVQEGGIRGHENVLAQGKGAVVAGHRGVAIGGIVRDSVINTGDRGGDTK